jgi:hypothetical protein
MRRLNPNRPVTLILHDWGGMIGRKIFKSLHNNEIAIQKPI